MKHFKASTALACLAVIILLSSCLKSSKGVRIDGYDLVTVESYAGLTVDRLVGDFNNQTYYPTNPNALKLVNVQTGEESYMERASIAYSYPEEESAKSSKRIKIEFAQNIPVLPLNEARDTIKLEEFGVPIYKLEEPIRSEKYLTLSFQFSLPSYGDRISINNFILFIEDFNEDTLFLRFVDRRDKKDFYPSMQQGFTISYRMNPQTVIDQCPNLDISDSINVVMKYNEIQGNEKELKPFKILVR